MAAGFDDQYLMAFVSHSCRSYGTPCARTDHDYIGLRRYRVMTNENVRGQVPTLLAAHRPFTGPRTVTLCR